MKKQACWEAWEVYYAGSARVGHGRIAQFTLDGPRNSRKVELEQRLRFNRAGQQTTAGFEVSSIESEDGRLRSFKATTEMGTAPVKTLGRVVDGGLIIKTTVAGRTQSDELPWPANARGFLAVEQSLRRRPMQKGETRRIVSLAPAVNVVVTTVLTAGTVEPVALLGDSARLLRIDKQEHVPLAERTQTLTSVMWVDRRGEIRKTHVPNLGMTAYRVSKREALRDTLSAPLDLFETSLVRISPPLAGAHRKSRIRYKVELSDADPMEVFPQSESQQLKSLDDRTAELTVESARLDEADQEAGNPIPGDRMGPANTAPTTTGDIVANSIIQSDDPLVIALANEAAPEGSDPLSTALALERFVHEKITEKNFSTAFATAADVAATLSGDCTEHAVLLAALARARGLPARVAMGLVYAPREQGFLYHMWTEVYVGDRWVGLDGTLGQGGLGPAHLKLLVSNLKGANATSCFLSVAQVMGQLKLDVLEVR